MQQNANEHTIPCPFDLFPNEIIQYIFEQGRPCVDPKIFFDQSHSQPDIIAEYLSSIQLVCRAWRSLCVSAPALWTTITWDNRNSLMRRRQSQSFPAHWHDRIGTLRLQLSRSKHLSIQIYICLFVGFGEVPEEIPILDAIAYNLAQHSYRIESLHLVNPTRIVWPIRSDWSALRGLSLKYESRCRPADFRDLPIQHHIPTLSHLRLSIDSDWGNATEQMLKTVNPATLKELNIEEMSLEDVVVFVSQCEGLQKLTIARCWRWDVFSSNTSLRLKIPFIKIDSIEYFILFCPVVADAITTLEIKWDHDLSIDPTLPKFPFLTSASIYTSSERAAEFVVDLMLVSPNLASLKCTNGTAASFTKLFSKFCAYLTKNRTFNSDPNSSKDVAPSFPNFRDFIVSSRLPNTTRCHSQVREILEDCPRLSLTIGTDIPSETRVYRGL